MSFRVYKVTQITLDERGVAAQETGSRTTGLNTCMVCNTKKDTHIGIDTHTNVQTQMHSHICTYAHMYMHADTHAHMYMHTHMHTCTHART